MANLLTVSRTAKLIRGWRCKSRSSSTVKAAVSDRRRKRGSFVNLPQTLSASILRRIIIADLSSSYNFGKGLALSASTNFYPPFDRLLRHIIPRKILQKMLDHRTMSSEKVRKRLGSTEQRPDFINTITTQNEGKGEKAMTLKEIELNMSVLVFAGSETTASGLSGIIRMLLQNPEAVTKLKMELRASFKTESDITIASVGRLEYLDAVIEEGIRLCPPV